jgi:competence protein ComEC
MVDEPDEPRHGHDLRMPLVGAAAWAGGIAAHHAGSSAGWLLAGLGCAALLGWRRRRFGRLAVAIVLVAAAVFTGTLLRHEAVSGGPLARVAAERAFAALVVTVVSDPVPVQGPSGEQVVVRVRVHEATARGTSYHLGATALVLGDAPWRDVALGERLRVEGRLAPANDPALSALITGARPPVRIRGPDVWWRAAAAVRSSIRAAVEHRPEAQRELVPALVVGDDAGLPPELEQDFRTTGLTHLTAVSGTNLTLIVGFLLLLARPLGVRGRWLHVVGLLGIVGFVLLARTEPSVLRAAAMGVVGLFALGTDGRRRGLRALGVAVTGLLLVAPGLAVSAGFALSVLATAGIVLLGPPLLAALGRWLPVPVAAAVAVPLAAQLACTPVVAALSGEVSLVAVAANVLAGPAVGPATVLGLAGGLAGLLADPVGRLFGTVAGWCVGWIVLVAERGAALPTASVRWGTGAVALAMLVLLCLGTALLAPRLLRRPWPGALLGVTLLVVVLGLPGRVMSVGGWPPEGWVLVACDVGQGDALAVATGPGSAIVVDAGPDPGPVHACLDRLDVTAVPLLVLTHFHADHVGGLAGVLQGRQVGGVEASPMLDPPWAVEDVRRATEQAGLAVAAAPYPTTRSYGDATVQVLWPDLPTPLLGAGDGSSANDASVVLLVETHGLRLLLTGDVEPPGQQRLAAALPDLDVDVLKVPHHGSRYQEVDWLRSLDAEVAVVSVGGGNDYGHPDPSLLGALERDGTDVARTDEHGDVAVVVGEDGAAAVVASD